MIELICKRLCKRLALSLFVSISASTAIAQCVYFDGFVENGDGTVTDPRDGLRWQKCAVGQKWVTNGCEDNAVEMNWADALLKTDKPSIGQETVWRLPAAAELASVMAEFPKCIRERPLRSVSSKLAYAVVPNGNLGEFWSLERNGSGAKTFDFNTGMSSGGKGVASMSRVRLVAGGSSNARAEFAKVYDDYVISGRKPLREAVRPDPAAAYQTPQPMRGAPTKPANPWDTLLEATGNKTVQPPPSTGVQVTGTSPISTPRAVELCTPVTAAGMMSNILGAIYLLEFFPPVDGASIWGQLGPQVKVTPVKVHAKYRDGAQLYTKAFLFQDSFGDHKCQKH